jgi:hypothetical protein
MSNETAVSKFRKQFIEEHGGIKSAIALNEDVFLFPDGARIESSAMGATFDPPEDRLTRLKLMVHYHESQVKRSELAFHNLKQQIKATFTREAVNYCGSLFDGNRSEAFDALEKQQRIVKRWRRELLSVRKQLDKIVKPRAVSREEAEADRIIAEQNRRFAERLRELKI